MSLTIEQHRNDRCLVLMVEGSLVGAASAKKLRSAIAQAVAEKQKLILVDLSGIGEPRGRGKACIDDFAVESLLAEAFLVTHAGGALRVFGTSSDVAARLESAAAGHLISRASTQDEAVEDLIELVPDAQPFDILQFVRDQERESADEIVPEPQEGG